MYDEEIARLVLLAEMELSETPEPLWPAIMGNVTEQIRLKLVDKLVQAQEEKDVRI